MRMRWLSGLGLLLCLLAPIWLCTSTAEARPGGGQSYSGGGGGGGGYSGGGGGGGGGYSGGGGGFSSDYGSDYGNDYDSDYDSEGGPIIFAVILVFLVFFVVVKVLTSPQYQNFENNAWVNTPYIPPRPPELLQIRHHDTKFSAVLFEDFLYHLYAAAHQARASEEELGTLAPHFTPAALLQLRERTPKGQTIDHVVIGSMTPVRVSVPNEARTQAGQPYYVNLAIRFESNMRIGDDKEVYYLDETWSVSRAANAQSIPEERMRATLCSNCGAPFAGSEERRCSSCDQIVGTGEQDWTVTKIIVHRKEPRPQSLTGYAPEVGTGDLTRYQNGLSGRMTAFIADDPDFSEPELRARVHLIFLEMYQSWNDDEIARVRPYVSDSLFNYLRYWLDAYRSEGLANWVENYLATKVSIAKIVRDAHYDAITIRIWASGKDYTVDRAERVVGGSKTKARHFSEYWTLIRSSKRRGKASAEKQCPQCGAEQKISMAGNCEYCKAHITSGEFDWVLSKIEQDESYRG